MAGLEGNIKLVSSGVQYALFIIFSSIMFFFVDKIGRRTLLIWGAIAMGTCHFVVGGTLGAHYTYVPEGVQGDKNVTMLVRGAPANTVIAFSYLLIVIYALTLAPICWVYAAEVWSLETRAWGMGIAAVCHHVYSRLHKLESILNNLTDRKLAFQLCHRPFYSSCVPQHSLGSVRRFWSHVFPGCDSIFLHIP